MGTVWVSLDPDEEPDSSSQRVDLISHDLQRDLEMASRWYKWLLGSKQMMELSMTSSWGLGRMKRMHPTRQH